MWWESGWLDLQLGMEWDCSLVVVVQSPQSAKSMRGGDEENYRRDRLKERQRDLYSRKESLLQSPLHIYLPPLRLKHQ